MYFKKYILSGSDLDYRNSMRGSSVCQKYRFFVNINLHLTPISVMPKGKNTINKYWRLSALVLKAIYVGFEEEVQRTKNLVKFGMIVTYKIKIYPKHNWKKDKCR